MRLQRKAINVTAYQFISSNKQVYGIKKLLKFDSILIKFLKNIPYFEWDNKMIFFNDWIVKWKKHVFWFGGDSFQSYFEYIRSNQWRMKHEIIYYAFQFDGKNIPKQLITNVPRYKYFLLTSRLKNNYLQLTDNNGNISSIPIKKGD